MTIDEEINKLIGDSEIARYNMQGYTWAELKQLAEWLEELKFIHKWKADVVDEFCKYDASSVEEIYEKGRQDAIDECYAMALNENFDTFIEWLQEQLKEQKNE